MSSKKNKLLESAQKNIQKGQYQRAISEYQELIRVDSGDVRHQQRLAELLTKVGRKDEAVKEYNSLAKHYIDNIHYVKAIAVYKQVQKLEPANAEICLTLASLNEKQGLAGNAAAEYNSALQIYEKNGENLKALKVLESMLALDPKNFAIRLRIAEKYFSTGNEDKSFAEFLSLAQSLKELNDESGLTHVMERTTKIFPKRRGELLAAVGEKAEEPVFVPQAVPYSPATPTRTPPQPAKTVISAPPSPARQMPAAPAKQEPAAPAKQQPVTPAKQQPAAPAKQEPAAPAKQEPAAPAKQQPPPEIQLAESQDEELFDFSEEPLIAELGEDDLIEDIIPIADLEELQEVGTEIPLSDSDWEEEIDITELEIATQAASVPEKAEYAEPMPLESDEEEIHELEEHLLEEHLLEEHLLEEQELEEQELEEQELEEQELEEQELEEQELEEQELAGLDIDLELEIEIEPESSDLVTAEVTAPEEEPADSAMDLAKELSQFADEIDFDVMKADSADDQFSMDNFASYTKGDLDREDSESHYSLGLAYKEMSLFEDAIAEFSVASRSPERKIDCFILQALCFRESGKVAAAIMLLSQTLEEPDLTENQLVSIKYELALCHEEVGEQTEARRLYSEIVTLRPDFSDAVERLTRL